MNDYITPDRDHAALVTIDAQRDYCEQASPVRSVGAGQARQPIERVVEGARRAGLPIYHMIRLYRPDGSNVDLCRRRAVEEGMRVLMPGSLGAELIEGVSPDLSRRLDPHLLLEGGVQGLGRQDRAIYKPRWGAFYDTPLHTELQRAGIDTLILVGCNFATSGKASILEATERDYRVVVVPDAASGLSEEAQRDLARVGVALMTVENCLNWLNGRGQRHKAA